MDTKPGRVEERPVGEGAAVDFGVLSGWDLKTMQLSPEFVDGITAVSGGRASILCLPHVIVPELAILPGMPAHMADVAELRAGDLFEFAKGDWATADPWLREDYALLVIPRIAAALAADLGDRVTITGARRPVSCVVAGIGVNRMMIGTSIIGQGAAADFEVDMERPFGLLARPRPGADVDAVIADSQWLLADYPAYSLIELEKFLADADGMLATLQGAERYAAVGDCGRRSGRGQRHRQRRGGAAHRVGVAASGRRDAAASFGRRGRGGFVGSGGQGGGRGGWAGAGRDFHPGERR
jgi:hypothetical protein